MKPKVIVEQSAIYINESLFGSIVLEGSEEYFLFNVFGSIFRREGKMREANFIALSKLSLN